MIATIFLLTTLALGTALVAREYQLRRLKSRISKLECETRLFQRQEQEISIEFEKLHNQVIEPKLLDRITNLPGLAIFEDRVLQIINFSKRFESKFAIMILDIDQFSVVNTKLGYSVGDKLLSAVAKRLQGEVRQVDTLATLGSGKFLFLLPQLSKGETAAYVAQRMQDAIIRAFNIDGQDLYIRANMGIVIYPVDGEDTRTLLKNAEQALNVAKKSHSHTYQFHHQETNELGKREVALKQLICGPELFNQLSIRYEYFFNVPRSDIEVMQASPTLSHPDYGLIDYAEFGKIAANNNKQHEVTAWLLNNAITQYQKHLADKLLIKKLLIPVSTVQIQHASFIPMLTKTLQEHLISPDQLVFEIRESSARLNMHSIEEVASALNQLGVGIAVSILGMGHFAIQQITKIPFNFLKIDGTLIESLIANQESKFILNMMLNHAAELNILIIAEGVDKDDQKLLLTSLGCETMQGKLFSLESMLKIGEATDAI